MKEIEMKKFMIISVVLISSIFIFLSVTISSQSGDDKVKSFNESIKHENDGKYDQAISSLTKIYTENKEDHLINIRLGWLYYQKKDYAKSKEYYKNSIRLNTSSIEAKLGLTLPLSALNEWDEIKKLYLEIINTDSKNYTANLRLGQIYLANADYSNAKKYLEVAYKLYTSSYEPNLSLGWTYYYLGDLTNAKKLLTQALMLKANDSSAIEGLKLIK
jgi:tetratricopeptide (TPR) repeat protein